MLRISSAWMLLAFAATGAAWAQPEVVTAEPVSVDSDGASSVAAEASQDGEETESLTQKIDIDLIDLELLREVAESQEPAGRIRLSLDECVRVALEANQDIEVAGYEPLKAAADVFASKGEFDPLLSGMASYTRATQEASPEYKAFGQINAFEVYRSTSQASVRGKLKWGTLYDITLDVSKEETTFNKFIEEWNTGLMLTLTQPVLRGRGKAVNLIRIRVAKKAQQMTELQLKLAVMTTVAEAVKAYWDLVGAVENLKVRQESLDNAERLLEISRKRLDIGTAAAIEVLQAKAGIATRQSELIAARSRVADAEDVLKQLLNVRDDGVFSSRRIVPIDRPNVARFTIDEFRNVEEALAKSIGLALEKRPEIATAELEIASAKLDRKRAANEMLPELNITGSVYQGSRNHYVSRAFTGMRERLDNSYTVGVQGSVPIGNRAARGAFKRVDLTVRQAEKKLDKTKQELMLMVRLAMRALQTSQILVESNRQAVALQGTNVVAEEKRLRLGISTSFRVLQVQEDLTLAQTQQVQAQTGYEKALVELRLAEGALLEELGIESNPPDPEAPVKYLPSLNPFNPKG